MVGQSISTSTIPEYGSSEYRFTPTQDWFSFNIDSWRNLFPHVTSNKPRILEIGSWEGRSAVFLLTSLCVHGGEIVCIDHFDLMNTEAGRERFAKITHNLTTTGKVFRILDEFSVPGLMTLLREEIFASDPGFDWVYIDGSHEADDTFLDGELVWRLSRKGAVLIFDDYGWDKEPKESVHHPKRGIDAFMQLHAGEFDVLSSPSQYQMILRKTSEMRIGFLLKEQPSTKSVDHDAFGYGVHIALTVDSAYALPATVVMKSALDHTPGRTTFYVVDLGLTEREREIMQTVISTTNHATIVFLQLREGSLSSRPGPTWAKIDMIDILPVERVLYLDADVLVRANLRDLWDVDLKGKVLAAAPDVGYPMGHDESSKKPYFNAGILLLDLAQLRSRFGELNELAEQMTDSTFRDQDVLNLHVNGNWLPVSLKWNAQGLGTYVKYRTPDRDTLNPSELNDPAIVHFTGPVNPSLAEVLNPHVQPYTAKPWGYTGAPGHPYAEEWWRVVEDTGWKGWKTSEDYRETCVKERNKAIEKAIADFEGRVAWGI